MRKPALAGRTTAAGLPGTGLPMLTELRAVVVFCLLMGLVSAGLLLGTWRVSGRVSGPGAGDDAGRPAFLLAWGSCCLIGALAGILFAARDHAPAVLVLGVNTSLLLATALFWAGARWLRGAVVRPWMIGLVPAFWLAACSVPAFYATPAIRVTTGGLLYATLLSAAAVELLRWRRVGAMPQTGRVLAGLAGLCGGAHLARIGLVMLDRADLAYILVALSTGVLLLATGIAGVALAGEQAGAREAAALRAGRADVARLHAGLPAVIFLRDVAPDGTSRLLYRGGDIAGVLGWPAEVLAQHGSLEAFMEPDCPPLAAMALTVLRRGSLAEDWRMRQPDGSWRWIRTRARLLSSRPDGGGEVVGYFVDITAERAAQAQTVAAARLASLGEMAAGLAHEMRQPLATITLALGNAQRALARGDIDAAAPRLDRAIAQALRAGALIEHLRRFARGAEAHAPVEPFALDLAVGGALALVGGALREAGIALEVALGTPPPVVVGHRVPLEQVLVNLLSNALHAMATLPEGAPRRLRIAVEPAEGPMDGPAAGAIRLTVADTAGGIAPEVMARLFEPFVTTKGPEGGSGLGLSICRSMVTAMGGTIEAGNGPDGAVFVIALPAGAAPRAPSPASLSLAEG